MNALIYTFDVLGLVFSCLVLLLLSIFIYFQNRRSVINRVFASLIFILFAWTLAALWRHFLDDAGWVLFLHNLTHAFGSLASIYVLYFVLIYPKERNLNFWTKLIVFVPGLFFAAAALFTTTMVSGLGAEYPHRLYLNSLSYGSLHPFYGVYSTLYLFGAVAINVYKLIRARGLEKKKLAFFTFAIFIGVFCAQFFTLWLPRLGVVHFDSLGHIALILAVGIIAYAIVKYRVFMISPHFAAQEILNALKGMVLVTDVNGKLLYQSAESGKIGKVHIDNIVSTVIRQGAQRDYRVMIDKTPYVVVASYFRGGVAIVLHDLTEVEIEEQKEREVHEELKIKLDHEKILRKTMEAIAKAQSLNEIAILEQEIKEELKSDSQAVRALARVAQLGQHRIELLEKLRRDKVELEEKLKQIEKINDESVERELKIIEYKEKLRNI